MRKFILRRFVQMLIVLAVSSILIFTLVRMSSTDPVSVILGGKESSQETIAAVKSRFHLDKPAVEQYFLWIIGWLQGNMGLSFKYQTDVSELLSGRTEITLGLVVMGSAFSLLLAIPLGILCAIKKNTLVDRAFTILTLILTGCPAFLSSILMILIITRINPNYPFTGSYGSITQYFERLFLPALSLAFTMVALAMRVTRTSMIDQQNAPYTMTAIAKGASIKTIIMRHNLKNAIIPVISIVSIQIGSFVVGAVLVENVFLLAGIGTLLIEAIKSSDYAVVQSITMLLILMFLVISTMVDIIYAAIDPRIRIR